MRKTLFCLSLLLTGMLVQAAPGGLMLRVSSPATDYILGEEISVSVTWKNESDKPVSLAYGGYLYTPVTNLHIEGPVRSACAKEPPRADLIPGASKLEPMKEKAAGGFSGDLMGIVDQGDYEIWVEYDTRSLDPSWAQFGVFPTHIESNHFRFKISAASGLDATVFQNHANACNQIALSPGDILSRYPASTYAGHVLAHRSVPFGTDPLSLMDDPDKTYRDHWFSRASTPENFQTHIKEATAAWTAYAKPAGIFLAAHPEFRYAPLIRHQYAMCLGLTGCLPEAIEQVKILAKGEGKEADEAKAYLASKGEKSGETQGGGGGHKK